MRTTYAAALAATLLFSAGTQAEDIIVESSSFTHEAWLTHVSRQLDARLTYPQMLTTNSSQPAGAVSVRFVADQQGRPAALEVVRGSGTKALDRAAMRAVSKLNSLHPMPAAFNGNHLFRADIVFASSPSESAALARKLRQDNARRLLVRKPGDFKEIVLSINPNLRS